MNHLDKQHFAIWIKTKKILNLTFILSQCFLVGLVQAENVKMLLEVNGEGTIVSENGTIECSENCELVVDADQQLTLKPSSIQNFSGWIIDSCDQGDDALISPTFNNISRGSAAKTIANADFDSDGDLDIVSLDLFSGTVNMQLNDGAGSFSEQTTIGGVIYPTSVITADWDGDNDQDILVVGYEQGAVYWLSNNGNATFAQRQLIELPVTSVYAIYPADVDQDGDLDLLVASFTSDISGDLLVLESSISSAQISWYLNNGNRQFNSSIPVASAKGAITLSAGDIDSDGDIDAVAALINFDRSVYFKNENGSFGEATTIVATDGAYGVAVADVDNDGDLDILTSGYWAKSLMLSINQGNGTFPTTHNIGTHGHGVSATDLADLNGDGLIDIVAGEFNQGDFFWYQNKSVVGCKVNPQEGRVLKVSFTEIEEASSTSDGSGGGGLSLLIGGLIMLLFSRKIFTVHLVN